MRQLIVAVVLAVGLVGVIKIGEAATECMSYPEARAKYPKDHLWWHTTKRCWDNVGRTRKGDRKFAARQAYADANANPVIPIKYVKPKAINFLGTGEMNDEAILNPIPIPQWPSLVDVYDWSKRPRFIPWEQRVVQAWVR